MTNGKSKHDLETSKKVHQVFEGLRNQAYNRGAQERDSGNSSNSKAHAISMVSSKLARSAIISRIKTGTAEF